ncbi:hypothetical protein N7470_003060 [Penicillium chermesinum]|nr:hypothetical protein N7470_003060 [Penicillium chermesinum]
MKTPSLLGPAAAGLSTLLTALPTAHAMAFDAISLPDLDLSSFGRVTITGDFNGVSLYEYKGQHEITQSNGSSSILTPLPNGILTNLTNADAQIQAMCSFTQKDGKFAGIFVGGNFSTLGGVESPGAALFNPNSSHVTALPGLNGSVSAVLCDQDTNSVYVGGTFSYKNNTNVVAWSPDDGWTDLSFQGLDGPVKSILKTQDGHIIFGGSFQTSGNSTDKNKKVGQQILNLQNAKITSDAQTSLSGYQDPNNVVCSTSGESGQGKTWLLDDASPGFWHADLGFTFTPSRIRLYNTHMDGRGTKSFHLKAIPDDGIMNLTYTDDSGKLAHCDQNCPLSDSTKEKYRDFTFVNSVGMQGFEIDILEWYGQGAGLNGIEVFQDEIYTYANNNFNEPTCAGIEYPATAKVSGDWSPQSTWLKAKVTDANSADTSVVFEPDVKKSGRYQIVLWTPGYNQANTFNSGGIANITVSPTKSGTGTAQPPASTQNQANEKLEYLYEGHVDAASDDFRPRNIDFLAGHIIVQPLFNLTAGSDSSSDDDDSGDSDDSDDLNGIFEWDPTSKADSTDSSKSQINKVGASLGKDATITSLAENDGVIYAGGNFSDKSVHYVMAIDDGNATALSEGGLNRGVNALAVLGDTLYVGGNFTDTSDGGFDGLSYVASYSFSSKKWAALGKGLDGPVRTIYPIELNVSSAVNETTLAVSGDFTHILAANGNAQVYAPGFAIWIPSNKTWLQTSNVTQMQFAGQLAAVATVNDTSILAGSLATDGYTANDAVWLDNPDDKVNLIPLSMNVDHSHDAIGLVSSVYDTSSGRNLTILGGQFNATASDGSTISNLALLNGTGDSQVISGLPKGLDSNSTFIAMYVYNDTLYAGGNITGSIDGSSVNGFVTYNLTSNEFVQDQPWSLRGGDVVTVNAIAKHPGSSDIYVGGDFKSAGSLPCATVCALGSDNSWSWPGVTISGNVLSLNWASSETLYAAGDIEVSGTKTLVATFNTKSQNWTPLKGASESDLPGTLTAFAPAKEDISEFWIGGTWTNGSAYFLNYDGSKFQTPGNMFSEGTSIRGLEILPLKDTHSSVSLLNDDQTLLIMGELVIPGFGNASAALYNGTAVTPFILSSKYDGQPGSMSQLISENNNPYDRKPGGHSNGIVVVVALCCALGCVFLIVVAGVILNKIQRRRQGYTAAPQTFGTDRPTDMQRVPPEYLFNSLGRATLLPRPSNDLSSPPFFA